MSELKPDYDFKLRIFDGCIFAFENKFCKALVDAPIGV
jgi:hypothetical protein